MKETHKTTSEQRRLLELWKGESEFGRPLGCVATTFTFDAGLFEEQCLANFLTIQSNSKETAKAYLIEREEKLSQCFACVLVDSSHAPTDRSLRWNLLPVALPGGGVLHAKLTLLVWEKGIRVLIGSANLTEAGYRQNQEVMAVFDFGVEGGLLPELLEQCVEFLHRVRRFAPGSWRKENGPQATLKAFLDSVKKRLKDLPRASNGDAECALVPLIPGGISVIARLEELWKGSAPDRARVLSPFFDKEPQANKTAESFAGLLTTRGERQVTFSAPGRRLTDGVWQIDAPQSLKESSHPSLRHEFSIVRQRFELDGKEQERALHAKSIWLEREERALYMVGSSNFTAAGLGLHPRHNIELNAAYLIKNSASRFGKLCAKSWPQEEKIPRDLDEVSFLCEQIDSAENRGAPILPRAFGLALYYSGVQGGRLELEIGEDAPQPFEIRSADGRLLLDSSSWVRGKEIPWTARQPPSLLEVRWQNEKGEECTAGWVVNVANPSDLPPPEELGSLTLAELMEILTSARPMHEMVARVLERRERKNSRVATEETDPHKKVDTSQFLLRRMRRLSQALEGLRERLQQPVGFIDALRWRLRGPVGPIALAKQLAEENQTSAAFMITEVAATLREVKWQPFGVLSGKEVINEVGMALRELRDLAYKAPAPPSLRKYMKAEFKEM